MLFLRRKIFEGHLPRSFSSDLSEKPWRRTQSPTKDTRTPSDTYTDHSASRASESCLGRDPAKNTQQETQAPTKDTHIFIVAFCPFATVAQTVRLSNDDALETRSHLAHGKGRIAPIWPESDASDDTSDRPHKATPR